MIVVIWQESSPKYERGDTGDSARVLYHAGVEVALDMERYA